jgi:uncharacterized protein (DUF2062 family)
MFRRRDKLGLGQRVRNFVWPRAGWWRASKYVVYRVRRLPGAPAAIALGFACGAFVSFTPLFGLHYLLAIALAWALRGSVIASFFGANLGWFYPFVLVWTYKLGTGIIGASGTSRLPPHPGWGYLLHHPWNVFLPTMIGSIPIGLAVAAASFAFTYWIVVAYRNFRRHRLLRRVRRRATALEEYRP